MKLLIVGALMTLAGCAHTAAFMQAPPTTTFQSFVPAKDLAFCIADKEHAAQRERDDGSYLIEVRTIYGGSGEAFVIRPKERGASVAYWKAHGLPTIRPTWKQCLGPSGGR